MPSVIRMAKSSLFIAVVTLGTVLYVFLFEQRESKIRTDHSTHLSDNYARSSAEDSLRRDLINVSKHIYSLQQENAKTREQLANLSRESRELLRHLETSVSTNGKVLEQLDNRHLNVNVSLPDIQYLTETLKKLWEEKKDSQAELPTSKSKSTSLLTLFTTWGYNPNKYPIYNTTVMNWASFKPVINPVVFTSDLHILSEVKKFGWEGLKIPKSAENGFPVLKYMYMEAIKTYDSVFYAYANADIVFTGSLVQTLTSLQYSDIFRTSKHMLISGVRTNLVVNFTVDEISKRNFLRKATEDRGTFFMTSAEDYFITDKSYPWEDIPEVVIGIVAYDNFLIANARNLSYTVIDASRTIPAVHLSESSYHFESHEKGDASYNKILLDKIFGNKLSYYKGFTDCIELFTELQDDRIVVQKRTQFAYYC